MRRVEEQRCPAHATARRSQPAGYPPGPRRLHALLWKIRSCFTSRWGGRQRTMLAEPVADHLHLTSPDCRRDHSFASKVRAVAPPRERQVSKASPDWCDATFPHSRVRSPVSPRPTPWQRHLVVHVPLDGRRQRRRDEVLGFSISPREQVFLDDLQPCARLAVGVADITEVNVRIP